MELGRSTAAQVGRLYDETMDLLLAAMGGNIHLGYRDDERDASPVERTCSRFRCPLSGPWAVIVRLAPISLAHAPVTGMTA